MLIEREDFPQGLLDAEATELQQVLDGPTLLHLPGRRPEPLFLSVLMHGNETTGWYALREWFRRNWKDGRFSKFPRALSVFIGNVAAARHGLRKLDEGPDYNRIWPGGDPGNTPEHAMMRQVLETMRRRNVFASIDIHNNTGINPHYACVNVLDHRFFHLATLFSRTVVYFIRPTGVQSAAFAQLCPSVTLECGQPEQSRGVEHALEYVEACMHLAELPSHAVVEHDIDLFHTVAIVKVPDDVRFGFGSGEMDLRLAEDIDHLNFRELPAGTTLGWITPGSNARLDASDEQGRDVSDQYFQVSGDALQVRVPIMPSMLTRDQRVIQQDCLCYLMERFPLPR